MPWYKERMLQKVSLGSLLMIVLLRTAHYNLAKLKVCGTAGTCISRDRRMRSRDCANWQQRNCS